MRKEKEPTHAEILGAINNYATKTEQGFNGMEQRFNGIDKRFDGVDKRLNKIEATMVTKDFLTDKLADLRGDLVVLTRKEDRKFCSLVNILHKRKLISQKEVQQILSMEPFPQIFA